MYPIIEGDRICLFQQKIDISGMLGKQYHAVDYTLSIWWSVCYKLIMPADIADGAVCARPPRYEMVAGRRNHFSALEGGWWRVPELSVFLRFKIYPFTNIRLTIGQELGYNGYNGTPWCFSPVSARCGAVFAGRLTQP